jgi:chromosome segregation ATPase
MTFLGLTLSDWLAISAALGVIYGLVTQRQFMKSQAANAFSEADHNNVEDALALKAIYQADFKGLRADLEKEHAARICSDQKLNDANKLIDELRDRDQKRETTMAELQDKDQDREAAMTQLAKQFERDAILRANIETALALAKNQLVTMQTELTSEREARKALEGRFAEAQQALVERDKVILDLQVQITALKRGQTSGGLLRP